jgi:hypothetical protein
MPIIGTLHKIAHVFEACADTEIQMWQRPLYLSEFSPPKTEATANPRIYQE